MSTVETIEQAEERRMRRLSFLLLGLLLVVALGVLGGRSWFGPDDPGRAADGATEVLSGVLARGPGPADASANSAGGSGVSSGGGPPAGVPPGPPDDTPAQPQTFELRGDLAEVYPGFDGTLTVTLTNPHRFAIVVNSIEVAVGPPTGVAVGDGPCLASHLEVDEFSGDREVGRLGTAIQGLDARMSSDAPDACQGASFPLSYSGTATRANQQ